jgi:hypothetical protein
MVAVLQRGCGIRKQAGEPVLALDQRPRAEILAIEMEQVEQEEDQRRRVAAIRRDAGRS